MTRHLATIISAVPWLLITAAVIVSLMASRADGDDATAADMDWGCAAAAAEYHYFGDVNNVPMTLIEGSHLQVCEYREKTCCSSEMESVIRARGRTEFTRAVADRIVLAKQIFLSRAAKFDAFFVELLNNSRQNMEEAFGHSHGYDSQMFVDLYRDLKSYYKGTDISLSDSLDRFFTRLAVRLLQDAGSTAASIGCVAEQVDRLRAFGNTPRRLASLVRRSFIAARNFVHGLAVGRDTVAAVDHLEPGVACVDDVTRLLYCRLCAGRVMTSSSPRCRGHCGNIVRACLAVHADVNTAWNDYLYELLQLSEKLDAPYNIEHVANTLHQRLSDAVTTFQQNVDHFITEVQSCSESAAGETWSAGEQRVRRSDPTTRRDDRYGPRASSTDGAASSPLTRLIRETRGRLHATRHLWRLLPEQVCDELTVAVIDNSSRCWNGRSFSRDVFYDANVANPPLPFDVHRASSSDRLVFQLQTTSNKLRNAFHGVDVSWIDSGEDMSGSGSGDDETLGHASFRDQSSGTNHALIDSISYIHRLFIASLPCSFLHLLTLNQRT